MCYQIYLVAAIIVVISTIFEVARHLFRLQSLITEIVLCKNGFMERNGDHFDEKCKNKTSRIIAHV